jgi:hypothetical protein
MAWLLPLLAVVASVGGALHLVERGALTVQQCVPGSGLGRVGLGLAMLRVDEACPYGTLAIGGDRQQVLGVVVVVALPVLLGNLAGAALGIGVLARLRGILSALLTLLGALRRRPSSPAPLPAVVRVRVDVPEDRPASRAVVGVPWWRGPPRVSFA